MRQNDFNKVFVSKLPQKIYLKGLYSSHVSRKPNTEMNIIITIKVCYPYINNKLGVITLILR